MKNLKKLLDPSMMADLGFNVKTGDKTIPELDIEHKTNGLDLIINWKSDDTTTYDAKKINKFLVDEVGQWPSYNENKNYWSNAPKITK